MIIALITETRLVSVSDLLRLCGALEIQAQQIRAAWMINEPVAIEVFQRNDELPEGVSPIVFVSDGGDESTLGEHWFAGDRPAARVFVENTSGLNAGSNSASETASHELELLVNPELALWWNHPTRPGVQIAAEISDPTQDHYIIEHRGTRWQVSNFVTPFWTWASMRDPREVDRVEREFGYGLDWCRRMREPGEILGTGYAIMREVDARGREVRRWPEGRDGRNLEPGDARLSRKHHHASRTNRLGGVPGSDVAEHARRNAEAIASLRAQHAERMKKP